ncbi:hypothetical protein PC129_g18261 [Phytophthora cactorum]|uniref:Uncharacterized protein n=1 Tax=Phytophthora cactorum TaxID=29920 RepID=A0A8T1HFC0_9STRA|nr:hypothetical protein PC129_g18261 [Phytophthora cactorum]
MIAVLKARLDDPMELIEPQQGRSLTEEEEVKQLEAGDESRSGPTDTEHFVSGAAGEPSSHSEQQDLAVTPGPSASSQTTTSVPRECRQNKSFKDFDH